MSSDTLTMKEVDEVAAESPAQEPSVVEADDTPLTRQVIANDDARSFKRVVNAMMKRRVGLMAVCLDCQDAERGALCQYARKDDTGELLMACQCTVRILEGVTR